jgi:hypothetical protein
MKMNLKEAKEKYGIIRGKRQNYYQFYPVKPTGTRNYGLRGMCFYRYVKQNGSGVLEREVLNAADGWLQEYFHWNEIVPVKEAAEIAKQIYKLSERYLVHDHYKNPVIITNQISPYGRQTGHWIAQLGEREFREMWDWLGANARNGVMLLGDTEMLAHDPDLESAYRDALC